MSTIRTGVLAGMAALTAVGVGIAVARDAHTLEIQLPDGSVAQVEYSGNVTPRVMLAPVSQAVPLAFDVPDESSLFDAVDQQAAAMDRQARALMQQVAQLQAMPRDTSGRSAFAASGTLPTGMMHYELISSSSRSGTCTRSVEMTSFGPGAKPRVVTASSGTCKPVDTAPAPVRLEPPDRTSGPTTKTRMAEATGRPVATVTA